MKILCTGGAGYVGSVLVPRLLKEGHLVTVIDNFMYNQSPLLDYCYSSNLEIIRHDITDFAFMQTFLQKRDFDLIIPMACLTGAPLCNAHPDLAKSIIKTAIENMLPNIKKETRIIYPTTNSGYGIGDKDKMCTEETPSNPISIYGSLKFEAEKIILNRGNAITLRLATAFGLSPRMRLDLLVNDFVYRGVNDRSIVIFEGHFRRNFIHVRDIAGAISHCIKNWETMKNETYNVGLSSANLTKIELAEKIEEHLPMFFITESNINEDPDKRDYVVSNEKLEKTGWKAIYDLDDGIKELIKGYKIIHRKEFSNV